MPTSSVKPSLTSRIRQWVWDFLHRRNVIAEDPDGRYDWERQQWRSPFLGWPNYIHGPAREAHKLPMTSDYETWLCQDFLTRTQFRFTFKWWDMDDRESYYELIGRWVAGGDRF